MKNLFPCIVFRVFASLIFCFTFSIVNAQPIGQDVVYDSNKSASFHSGITGLFEFIKNTINYPKSALADNVKQKVGVQIIVNKDGSISNITTPLGLRKDFELEVYRIISLMPKWSPALKNGQAVTSTVFFNISFVPPK